MPVGNQFEVRMEVRRILRKSLSGKKSGRRKRVDVAKVVAEAIFLRWRKGPFGWKLKHIIWYCDAHMRDAKQATRYEHWRAIKTLLERTGKEHMIDRLSSRANADYLRPSMLTKKATPEVILPTPQVTNPNTIF